MGLTKNLKPTQMSQLLKESDAPDFYKVKDKTDRIARITSHYENMTIQKLHQICPVDVKKSNIKPEMIKYLVQYWL